MGELRFADCGEGIWRWTICRDVAPKDPWSPNIQRFHWVPAEFKVMAPWFALLMQADRTNGPAPAEPVPIVERDGQVWTLDANHRVQVRSSAVVQALIERTTWRWS